MAERHGWSVAGQPGQRLTLFKVGPYGPQLTLGTDIADHDEQGVFSQIPARRSHRGTGLTQRLRRVLSRRCAGAPEPQLPSCLHGNAARPRGPGLGRHGNSRGVLGWLRPLRGECAQFLKAGGRSNSLVAACLGGGANEPQGRGRDAVAVALRSTTGCCHPPAVFLTVFPSDLSWGSGSAGSSRGRSPRPPLQNSI